jgi:hypothetical protein
LRVRLDATAAKRAKNWTDERHAAALKRYFAERHAVVSPRRSI